jgi:LysR family transcriptional regulator, hydrogen peroxide-inducible genes activator
MNFRDLEYLSAVARLVHFTKAAEECHVSQSALSLQLQKLERELGAQLLERTNRRVILTEAGKEAVRRARELLQGRQELLDSVRHFSGELPSTVTIGAIPTIAPFLFADLQARFCRRFPATTPRFDEQVTEQLVASVAGGELEAGILATPVEDTLLDAIELFEEPFLLAVPMRHALSKKNEVEPRDLASDELLLLKDAHCLREQVMDFCKTHHVSGSQQSAATTIATLLALVRSNGGITLIPKMAGAGVKLPGLRCLPVKPPPTRRVRVIFRKTSRVGRRLAEAIRTCVVPNE